MKAMTVNIHKMLNAGLPGAALYTKHPNISDLPVSRSILLLIW